MATAAPKHLYIIGIIVALWDSMGIMAFLVSVTRNDEFMKAAGHSQEAIDLTYSLPMWDFAIWGIAVFSGLGGVACLLMRKRIAVEILVVSFICAALSNLYCVFFTDWLKIMGNESMVMIVVVIAVAAGIAFYSRKMRDAGVLT